ncbi:helix-turn-helix domain-containing protein [Vibrio sinensis]|uniref:Helix-turn-helix domain-containing protein n=1 Tax=Vibrio sinensis TaxID=2302434 RepID=A0A3A6R2V4_9VIBR|nr:DNA-binding transcriptional regulator [Vibrio sinensis]RJX75674.1 helix-turn-helix domain-containing protein [Vibrio sinensis]
MFQNVEKRYRITLLFNANKVYDREVIKGIGEYLQATQCNWDIFLEEDFLTRLENIKHWMGDGVIADMDNPEIEAFLSQLDIPIIGVGGSYKESNDYPSFPYVATDNYLLIQQAFEHLKNKGIESFAFYGLPKTTEKRWANEREMAFNDIVSAAGYTGIVYRGNETSPQSWQYDMNRLADWLQKLPSATGIIAVTDSRARHILQVCEHLNLLVPDNISVIGIDNEELTQYFSRVSLSSVGQGCKKMGYEAAKLLHKMLTQPSDNLARIIVPPSGIHERQSSDYHALRDPYVIQAMHYIRQNACRGIKVDQVLNAVGISRSNLEFRFKEERGHSIHHEIHNSKLDKACQLLSSTSLPIAEIAELCGYPSLQYMYTVFKKKFESTPKEYRNEKLVEKEPTA